MRKRDELAEADSCLNRARPDEWVFTLLGRDVAAPYAIREWAARRVALGKNRLIDPQIAEALAVADAMEREQ